MAPIQEKTSPARKAAGVAAQNGCYSSKVDGYIARCAEFAQPILDFVLSAHA